MTEVADTVERFLLSEVRPGYAEALSPDDDLVAGGILDSLGIQQLVAFLEDRYRIRVRNEDVVPENFRSLSQVERFVDARVKDAGARPGRRLRSRWG